MKRPMPADSHDYVTHPCGCVTYFDIAKWCVVRPTICEEHMRMVARLPHFDRNSRDEAQTGEQA